MNETIEMCPGVKAVEMFLADDSSLDPSMESQLVSHLGSQKVTAADAASLDSMSSRGSASPSSAAAASSGLTTSGTLPAELTLEGRAQAQAFLEAAARKEKEQAETMDALPTTLVITTAAEEIGGNKPNLSLSR
jgi:precorrin-4 methylase